MTKRIAIGMGLLLTLGTAVGGTYIYGQSGSERATSVAITTTPDQAPTRYTIAMWKATASSADFASPKVPL